MSRRHLSTDRWIGGLILLGLVAGLSGCGNRSPVTPSGETGKDPTVSIPSPGSTPGSGDPSKPPEQSPTTPNTTPTRDAAHQPFEAAVSYLAEKSPPLDSNRPPDRTIAGKPVFAIYQQVKKEWDNIRFTSPAGKKITWTATIETDKGTLEVSFYPEQAPNHVRSFLALARAGYYEGLCFERKHEESLPDNGGKLEQLEFGCPEGTGDPGNGSIGYWLKPEFNSRPFEEGTLAAIHSLEEDTAACRCYITLGRAPFLDGKFTVFGKVTRGLDIARIIFQQPVAAEDAERPGSRRVAQPIKITKVILLQQEG